MNSDNELELVTQEELESGVKGYTGISWFMSILPELKIKESESVDRMNMIKAVDMAKKECKLLINKLLVIPAGFRDLSYDTDNRPVEHEVNDLYRKVIAISRSTKYFTKNIVNSGRVDEVLLKLTLAVYEVYKYFIDFNNGKHKFLRSKFTKRTLASSRNTITGTITKEDSLFEILDKGFSMNHIKMGTYQFCESFSDLIGGIAFKRYIEHRINLYGITLYNSIKNNI